MKNITKADFVNDADYPTQVGKGFDKWVCPFYRAWASMKDRVGGDKPAYAGTTICEDWLHFSKFKRWVEKQPWEGRQLDKDILYPSAKRYSPETCRFVPAWINTLVVSQTGQRGMWPIGVHQKPRYKRQFAAQVGDGLGGKLHLGYFYTAEEAHQAYLKGKAAVVKSAIERWTTAGLMAGDFDIVEALKRTYVEVEKYVQE